MSCAEHHVSPRLTVEIPILRSFFSDLLPKKPPAKQAHTGVHTTEQFMPWWNDEFRMPFGSPMLHHL
jgi:hypothetical protein